MLLHSLSDSFNFNIEAHLEGSHLLSDHFRNHLPRDCIQFGLHVYLLDLINLILEFDRFLVQVLENEILTLLHLIDLINSLL